MCNIVINQKFWKFLAIMKEEINVQSPSFAQQQKKLQGKRKSKSNTKTLNACQRDSSPISLGIGGLDSYKSESKPGYFYRVEV